VAAAARVLVSGFEPFGGDRRNVSGRVAQALDGARVAGHALRGVVLPCAFASAPGVLQAAIDAWQPSMVLCLGLAPSRRGFTPERVAINWVDARIADNHGAQPVDVPVRAGAPAAVFTRLPVKAMTAALRAAGFEAELSWTAGSFVCNQVFFTLCDGLDAAGPVRGGFMHLGGELDDAVAEAGVRVALAAALTADGDLAVSAGRID
jgi:pyroglutamyl-peptidase